MAATQRIVLDTSVVLHLVRASDVGKRMDKAFDLRGRTDRPLISIVTVGEALSFATQRGWGDAKRDRLVSLLAELLVIDLQRGAIVERYAQIDAWAKAHGVAMSKNDVWIAATTVAADGTLITNDKDFNPLTVIGLRSMYVDPAVQAG